MFYVLIGLWLLCVAGWLGYSTWMYTWADDDATCPVYVEGQSDPYSGPTGEVAWQSLPPPGVLCSYEGVFDGQQGEVLSFSSVPVGVPLVLVLWGISLVVLRPSRTTGDSG